MKISLFRFTFFLLTYLTLSLAATAQVVDIPEPVPPPKEVRDFFNLVPFYQQWIDVDGFPVVASAQVNPYALKEAAWQIWQMIGHRSDILKILAQHQVRLSILAHNEMTSDIPELTEVMVPHFFYNVRSRGANRPLRSGVVCSGEEVLLNSNAYAGLIHGFSHTIHTVTTRVDPEFDNRLKTTYNAAMEKGLWRDTYAATNRDEYWAEGVGSWFDGAHSDNPVKTRDALKAYDPDLATLIGDFLGDHAWRYTPLARRLHLPHLQGFDPQSAPQLEYPPGALEAYAELRDPTINERSEWVNLPPYGPSLIRILNESRISGDLTDIFFVNLSSAELLLYRVDPDGTERLTYRFPPNPELITQFTIEVGGLLLAKGSTGKNIAVFQAVEKAGRALVAPTPLLVTPGLSKISGDNQTGIANAVLANPLVVQVRDENLSVLEGISVTFTVTGGDGTFSVTRTITDEKGRAENTLTLGPNQGTNTVSVSASGIEGTVTFNATAEAAINIPDPNLRAAVEGILGKASGATITASDMARLTRLEARNANISDLTGLEHATNLTELLLKREYVQEVGRWINSSSVSDLSPLVGLINLTVLRLEDTSISDISPVTGLTNLTKLWLGGNAITDISPVSRLTNLTGLSLWSNAIMDISPLAGLTNLTRLELGGNNIADISHLAGLTNLTGLWLGGNAITDILPLASLTNLTRLELGGSNITDISPLAGLTSLTELVLKHNYISDISPLVANTGLGSGDKVYVQGNPLSYQSIHTHIPDLQSRGGTVEFDNRAHPALLKISGDNQNGASLVRLSQPFVVEAQDANGSALVGISVRFAVIAGGGTLSTTITRTNPNGRAQSTFTLGPNLGTNIVSVSATGIEVPVTFYAISDTEAPPIMADVNNDGSVNVLDLILITSNLDTKGANLAADVNRDGVVNVLDLVLAAGMFDVAAAAPSAQPQAPETLTAVEVQGWLTDARALEVRDLIMKRGIMVLEQLLISLTPKETELLPNYPNPFNPETWIPYRLAEDAFVTLTIYDSSGHVVRTLEVGHRIASAYENRSKAIYWDGRNDLGEWVASGVYFYHLSAGDYSATRRMVILK